jgi:hypothetical protein
MDIMGKTAG